MARHACRISSPKLAVASVIAVWTALGCNPSERPDPHLPSQLTALHLEVQRLSMRIASLERQLQIEHRAVAKERLTNQEQRERLASLEAQSSMKESPASSDSSTQSAAAHMTAEAELRQAYRAVMRAIERMNLSAEEKAALKNSLRPTRPLDSENPWASARQ